MELSKNRFLISILAGTLFFIWVVAACSRPQWITTAGTTASNTNLAPLTLYTGSAQRLPGAPNIITPGGEAFGANQPAPEITTRDLP